MSASAKFTAVDAYRAYVEKFSDKFITHAFFGAKSLQYIQLHEGIKGRLTLTQMLLGDLSYRWGKSFAPTADTVEFKPRHLDVIAAKSEFQFVPQEFESSYLGMLRQTGQSPTDLPQEGFMIMKLMEKIQQEIEVAIWQGDAASSPASTDKVKELFDGFIKLVVDLRTGGSPVIPATAVSGGAYTTANIVGNFETMFKALDPAYQDSPLMFCVSNSVYQTYIQAYRENYSKYVNVTPETNLTLDLAPNCKIINFPGMGTSQTVILTTPDNLHYGYDGASDATAFNFEQDHRAMDFWCDFKLGVQIGLADPKCLRVNDL